MSEQVYCTLLLNDAYLPGAKVLAHSLRDAGTTKRLAIMVTLSGLSKDAVTELKKLYDYVIPVDPLYSQSPANLDLMRRPDLKATLTKLHLWNQTQFSKVVFVDADVVALRAPDELFEVDAELAAAPDVGWPDCFNSGVMVVKPNSNTYGDLLRLAADGSSYDGADQGLLNQHFSDWHRLSFTYNCTVGGSQHYQYAPAFNHYGSKVSMVHFIGDQKPWNSGNVPGLSEGGSGSGSRTGPAGPYNQLSGRWWDVYNKHQGYSQSWASGGVPEGKQSTSGSASQAPGGTQASGTQASSGAQAPGALQDSSSDHKSASETTHDSQDSESVPVDSIALDIFNSHYQDYLYKGRIEEFVKSEDGFVPQEKYYQVGADSNHIQEEWPAPEEIPQSTAAAFWDPVNSAPPQYGAPEAGRLQIENYMNAWDSPNQAAKPFVAPAFATVPEQHLWYDAPQSALKLQGAAPSKSIFPWEEKPRSVTRTFPVASTEEFVIARTEHPNKEDLLAAVARPDVREQQQAYVPPRPLFPWEMKPRTVTRVFNDIIPAGVSDHTDYQEDEYENKWDTDPAIRDYVVGLNRRKSQPPVSTPVAPSTVKEELPAPVRRVAPTWTADEGAEENGQKWDPEKKLEELRRLPPAFLAQLMAKHTETAGLQTVFKKPLISRTTSPTYSDSSIQTDKIDVEDKAIQADNESVSGESEYDLGSVTPRMSGIGPTPAFRDSFSLEDGQVALKEIRAMKEDHKGDALGAKVFRGRRSIDSAMGSMFSDEFETEVV